MGLLQQCPVACSEQLIIIIIIIFFSNVHSGIRIGPKRDNNSVYRVPCIEFHSNLKPRHAIYTAAVRTCAKFQIASVNESEDRDV